MNTNVSNDELIGDIQSAIALAGELLMIFEDRQNDESDDGNADNIEAATNSLRDAEGHVNDLIP